LTCELDPAFASPYECPGYRLPTEAEWEYAARAGTTELTYNGAIEYEHLRRHGSVPALDPIAWFGGNSGLATRAVATKRPNAFELHDMLGNVSEWVHDWYETYRREPATDPWGPVRGTERVLRGGNAGSEVWELRVTSRRHHHPAIRFTGASFRPVRSLD
jgi:formylglycine-generating enzyme